MKSMKNQVVVPALVAAMSLLPVQGAFSQIIHYTNGTVGKESQVEKKHSVKDKVPADVSSTTVEKQVAPIMSDTRAATVGVGGDGGSGPFSTNMMIGVGAGAALLIGGGIALAGGGSGGGGSDASASASAVPPTPDQLVSAWHVEGSQVGSGLTYVGTFQLYQGGALGYDLMVSDGEHLVGGGGWSLYGYQLQMHTDHGSLYSGSFAPGNISSISMNANTQWTITMVR